jgi:2-hydroxychromene-2-carboxylate isomerase
MASRSITWYFDFISPYAWLQAERFAQLPAGVTLQCRPVLFAGLLEHWGQLGPAEIAPKRVFTYQYIVWRAAQLGLSCTLPRVHPFNPLKLLRLAVLLNVGHAQALRLFRFVWSEGHVAEESDAWRALIEELGVADADARIGDPQVKDGLRRNGEEAVAQGVFGVPTAVVDGHLFWGVDATDMLLDYIAGQPVFGSAEMRRAETLPIGKARSR